MTEDDFDAQLRADLSGRKILLLEDEAIYYEPMVRILHRYNVRSINHVTMGEDARDAGIADRYDVMLFDRMVEGMDGLSALRAIRDSGKGSYDIPALIISSVSGAQEQARGLTMAGADDYVIKPAEELELVARIAACIRRYGIAHTNTPKASSHIHVNGPIKVNERQVTVFFDNAEVFTIKGKSFSLLVELMRMPSQPITQDMLFERCWPEYSSARLPDTWQGALFKAIERLRKELLPYEEQLPKALRPIIFSIRNRGYILRDLSSYDK